MSNSLIVSCWTTHDCVTLHYNIRVENFDAHIYCYSSFSQLRRKVQCNIKCLTYKHLIYGMNLNNITLSVMTPIFYGAIVTYDQLCWVRRSAIFCEQDFLLCPYLRVASWFEITNFYYHIKLLRDIAHKNVENIGVLWHSLKSPLDGIWAIWLDIPMNPNHKNGEIRPRLQKWTRLGGGQSWEFCDLTVNRRYKENFSAIKDFRKILKHDKYKKWNLQHNSMLQIGL